MNESINTGMAAGKLLFTIVAAFAQFERDNMIETTKTGLDAARAQGKMGGRPPKLDAKKIAMVKELRKDPPRTVQEICDVLKISRTTFYNVTGRDNAKQLMSEGLRNQIESAIVET